jgi:hypothetical protein
MDRRNSMVKAAVMLAGVSLLPVPPAHAQPCAGGYYYQSGYGCRAYGYGWPFALLPGLALGLLLHHHQHHGSGYPRTFSHAAPSFGGVIARMRSRHGATAAHGIGRLGAGFGGGAPPPRHAVAPTGGVHRAPTPAAKPKALPHKR